VRRWCPAKVNLYLKVLGRRPDGYHELVTVMQPLTLADELEVEPAGRGLQVECRGAELPEGPDNLVWRAALAFFAAVGIEPKARLRLKKRIPVAAGLGGGSSDAAGTLAALNALWGEPLGRRELTELAAALGADVPFFLSPRPQVGRGLGHELAPLDLPPYWYVLLNPGFPVSTAWVYRNLDLEALGREGAPYRDSWEGERPESWVANDLATVTLKAHPELTLWLRRLRELGARVAGMSGSGPTLFGLFGDREGAWAAAQELRSPFPGWLAVARGLTGTEAAGWEEEAWII